MTDTYHDAYWSDPSYSSSDEEEIRYSTIVCTDERGTLRHLEIAPKDEPDM